MTLKTSIIAPGREGSQLWRDSGGFGIMHEFDERGRHEGITRCYRNCPSRRAARAADTILPVVAAADVGAIRGQCRGIAADVGATGGQVLRALALLPHRALSSLRQQYLRLKSECLDYRAPS